MLKEKEKYVSEKEMIEKDAKVENEKYQKQLQESQISIQKLQNEN